MTLQRQYRLPNCSLTIEGLSAGNDADPTAPLAVVLNTECQFPGVDTPLTGGREFLDSLVKTVSRYAQSVLSGIAYPLEGESAEPVRLHPGENHRHELTTTVTDGAGQAAQKTLPLTTVQLFDLMEAVDQLLADTQTLPDMAIAIAPLNRRYVRASEPISKRTIPAAAGLSALAAAAAFFFVLPVPEVEPESVREEEVTPTAEDSTAAPIDPPPGEDSEEAGTETAPADELATTDFGLAITDPDELARLETDLEETLMAELSDPPDFAEVLVYRVTVSQSGDILGYRFDNDAALANEDETPLPDLTFMPVEAGDAPAEPTAQFTVTFDPSGEVTAEPFSPGE